MGVADGGRVRATGDCDPGPGCAEELHRTTFGESPDADGFDDVLTPSGDELLLAGLEDVRDLAVDPGGNHVLMADGDGVTIIDVNGERPAEASITDVRAVTFTADGSILVGLGTIEGRSTLEFFDYEGNSLQTLDIPQAARTYTDTGASLGELDVATAIVHSVTPGGEGSTIDVLLGDGSDATTPVLAEIGIAPDGSAGILGGSVLPLAILAQGTPQAVAR